jgi:thiosulfate reductase cytochrome b subunit
MSSMAVSDEAATTPDAAPERLAVPLPESLPKRETMYRHSVAVRVTHWVNALALTLLLMSGLRIFNYHPALYWGDAGYKGLPSFISITSVEDDITDAVVGVTTIAGHRFITTGVLGVSYDSDGDVVTRAFPSWLTLPSGPGLSVARDWHFAMAWLFVLNGVVYLVSGLVTGHFRRDLLPRAAQLRPRGILAAIWDRVRLRRPRGEAARQYNVVQKFAYLGVVFGLLPVMALTGLTMSPAVTAEIPILFDVFGGRQSARTIHFLVANLLVLFVLVHIVQVFVAGVFNTMRGMITGRYAIRPETGQ